ncbi:MAG: hypothetical protein IAF38_10520, partial [Bacteroidia bacterium]|nr:hypothetical protein [Bacteroidia bacterium]
LEKSCWEKNIFELLPSIIDNLIFCNQLLNKLERNVALYKRMEDALELQADIYRVISLARKIYEINFRKGISFAKNELAVMKDISLRHRDYPRFDLCYHHVSLYYKLGSSDYIEDMQVISRHFGQLRELIKKYPHLPIVSYRRNYQLYQHMHYRQMTVFYHYNRCEFEDAYKMMKEFWDNVTARPDVYAMYRSESFFFNMFNCTRSTLRFTEADKIVDAYASFLKENKNSSKLVYAYTQKAMLYTEAWPNALGMQTDFLKQKLDEYLKQVKDDNNVQTGYGEALVIKSRLCFLEKDFNKALALIKKPEAEKFLLNFDLCEMYNALYNYYVKTSVHSLEENTEAKNSLKKKLSKEIALTKKPVTLMSLRWVQRILESKKF